MWKKIMLNSYTNSKYKLLNGVSHDMTIHCELLCDLVHHQAPKARTSDSHARTSFQSIKKCAREE